MGRRIGVTHARGFAERGDVGVSADSSVAVAFDGRGCDAVLRKRPQLRALVERTVTSQLENGLFKSKFATTSRWEGLPLWECRVNAGAGGPVRVAFVVRGETATVVYLSSTLQKRAFTVELDRFLARRRP